MFILTYHNVVWHAPSAFNMLVRKEWVQKRAFEEQIAFVAERFGVVPLEEIVAAVRAGRSIPNACAITFDDGYAGVYTCAAPVLERYGLPATFFVVTQGMSDGEACEHDLFDRLEAVVHLTAEKAVDLSEFGLGVRSLDCDACKVDFIKAVRRQISATHWSERDAIDESLCRRLAVPQEQVVAYLEHDAYRRMSWEEARDLTRRGFAIGSHTRTHAPLSQLDGDQLEQEVCGSYADVREQTGQREIAFAYPFGRPEHMSEAAMAAVRRAGYTCGLTMIKGANGAQADLFQLHRVGFRDLRKVDGRLD